jgi:hypothetical protein
MSKSIPVSAAANRSSDANRDQGQACEKVDAAQEEAGAGSSQPASGLAFSSTSRRLPN